MALVNEHFLKLASNYLFADIAKKVTAYKIAHPKQRVISLGIGDVTQPLCPAVIKAMHKAVDEMAVQASFRGYGPERGYDFLREAIIKNDFLPRGIHLDANEVFVNDGAKSDTGNIQEILRWDNNIGVTDPIYPVYIDSNVMIGRAGIFENGKWSNVTYMPCDESDDFIPQIPDHRVDMIYLCYPNNPTGTVISKEELRKWVNYAIKNESIILYDAAYEAYITDPIYPVYIDSNVMIGRAGVFENGKWSNVTYMPCDESDDFIPQIPDHRVDMIYLCYPNNPTGTVISKEELRKWVNYAIKNESIILYDAAYEAYITDPEIPHSIYEIRGARKVAIEFHSYSKTAGFTGVRCGYTIVPKELKAKTLAGEEVALNPIWDRRQCTKFNGTSYISQRAAEAIYTLEGKEQVKATINYYMENAHFMRAELQKLGLRVYGGENAPYLWVKTPNNTPSWKFFEEMLYGASVVCTPGVGFGPSGEGYIRLTAFGEHEDCKEAMERIAKWLGK